jgi:hypothetical protein
MDRENIPFTFGKSCAIIGETDEKRCNDQTQATGNVR